MNDTPATEGPILLHIWMVDPSKADALVGALSQMFRQVAEQPGFVSARVLESPDRASIAAVIEMRTVEDRRQLEQLPEVRDTLHNLQGTANLVIRMYHVTLAFEQPPHAQPTPS
jgi:hypothetical protein